MSRTVEVRVAGQNYRVVSSAPEAEVRRLAEAVNAKLAELVPKGRAAPPNALLLAAIALAHDLEEEREQRGAVEERTRELLRRVVAGLDEVLGERSAALGQPSAPGRHSTAADEAAADEAAAGPDDATLEVPADEGGAVRRTGSSRKVAAECAPAVREVSRET